MKGDIITDFMGVTSDVNVKMPFLINNVNYRYIPQFLGILGLSPKDESAGPLLIDYLYESNQIEKKLFSILLGENNEDQSRIQYGEFQNTTSMQERYFDSDIN